jgi:hypothetical protein
MDTAASAVELMSNFALGSAGLFPGDCVISVTPTCACSRCLRAKGMASTPQTDAAASQRAAKEYGELCLLTRRALNHC